MKVWVGQSLGVGEGRIRVSGAGFVLLCERVCEWVWWVVMIGRFTWS